MKILATVLGLIVFGTALPAEEVAPPPPRTPPKQLTDEEIAAAEAWANEILRQDLKMVELPAADRERYEAIIEEVRTCLGKGMAALKVKDALEAGRLYVDARKRFNEIPREAGPSLGADYQKMSRAMLAFARIILELEAAEADGPRVDLPDVQDPGGPEAAPDVPADDEDPPALPDDGAGPVFERPPPAVPSDSSTTDGKLEPPPAGTP